jgi:hypothetical protein
MTDVTRQPASPVAAQLARTFTLDNGRLFAVAVALSVAPLWFGSMLPLVDMPQHAAQIAALHEMWSGNQTFLQQFEINWFTPYLLGYLLLYAIALVVPVAVATQALATIAVGSIALLTGRLLRVAGADERWKWLAIPGSFSFCFYWGFLSFIVAAPVALLFLEQSIRYAREPTMRRAVGIALFGIFLFFCHIIVLGLISLVALGYVCGRHYREPKRLLAMVLPFAAPLPVIAVWLKITVATEAVHNPVVFGPLLDRFVILAMEPAGLNTASALSLGLTLAIFALPPLAGARFSRAPERWLPVLLELVVFMCAPGYVLNAGFFYHRLGIFLVPLWLLAWDAPPAGKTHRLDWIGMVLVTIWLFANAGRFAAFARESESLEPVIAAIEPGKTVAAMIYDSRSQLFPGPVYMHFGAWYQAQRAGIVDFNFGDFYSQMVRYKKDAGPRLTEQLAWMPTAFQWAAHGGDKYDYFIVKANEDISAQLFKDKLPAVQLVGRSGWWWLYRNVERQQSSTASSGAQ